MNTQSASAFLEVASTGCANDLRRHDLLFLVWTVDGEVVQAVEKPRKFPWIFMVRSRDFVCVLFADFAGLVCILPS